MDKNKELICQAEDNIAAWAEEISDYIFNNPELSDEEYKSSAYLADKLSKAGFEVTYPYLGFHTSFQAVYCNPASNISDNNGINTGGNSINNCESSITAAFLAEYDALPGYGSSHNQPAHACGHNWIAGSTMAAARALKESGCFNGKIVLFGTQSEEKLGSKVNFAGLGAFDNIDAAFQMHLGRVNCVDTAAMAMTDYVFEFYGKEAHAAKEPENGINALDACHLTIAGINAMRQQFGPDVKIHETITNGGQNPNIIPAYASMWIFARASSKDLLEKVAERIVNIGKGAGLMTGAGFSYKRAENTFYDIRHNEKLDSFMKNNLAELGITHLEKGDRYHCESTDMGNVSYKCPACYVTLSTAHISDAGIHEQGFVEVAGSKEAKKLMHIAAKAMALTAFDVAVTCTCKTD